MRKILMLAALVVLSAGCANPLYKPSSQLAVTVLPEYNEYVRADSTLDSAQKERRVDAVNAYVKMLEQYKNIEGE